MKPPYRSKLASCSQLGTTRRIIGEAYGNIQTVGQPRKCVVSFRDGEGVEHVAEVTAASLYEAGALALQQFRRGEWSRGASLDAGSLRIEVCESTFYHVKVAELEAWLKRTGGAPPEVSTRREIQTKLAKSGKD